MFLPCLCSCFQGGLFHSVLALTVFPPVFHDVLWIKNAGFMLIFMLGLDSPHFLNFCIVSCCDFLWWSVFAIKSFFWWGNLSSTYLWVQGYDLWHSKESYWPSKVVVVYSFLRYIYTQQKWIQQVVFIYLCIRTHMYGTYVTIIIKGRPIWECRGHGGLQGRKGM